MNFPFLVILEVAFAGLLAAATTRFNIQVVGANLPDCDKDELATTVKQTTGFALIAGALSVQASDNIFQSGFHSLQTALWVTAIMSAVLLWQSLPTITAAACKTIDDAAEDLAEKGTTFAASIKEQLVAAVQTATQPKAAPEAATTSANNGSEPNTTATKSMFSIPLPKFASLRNSSSNAEKSLVIHARENWIGEKISRLFQGIIGLFPDPKKMFRKSSDDQMPEITQIDPDKTEDSSHIIPSTSAVADVSINGSAKLGDDNSPIAPTIFPSIELVSDASKAGPQEIDYQTPGEQQHVLL